MGSQKAYRSDALSFKLFVLTSLVVTLFYTSSAYAVPDVATMLMNFAQTVPNFMKLVTAIAYVMGMFFIVKGVIGLKAAGEARTQMSMHHDLKGPLVLLGVGTLLLYVPSSVSSGLNTFWTDPNPYGYIKDDGGQWELLIQTCYLVVQLIGTIAFVRGLITLTHLGGHGGHQPGTFGKGLMFIIGGVLCINMYDFLAAIEATLGIGGIRG